MRNLQLLDCRPLSSSADLLGANNDNLAQVSTVLSNHARRNRLRHRDSTPPCTICAVSWLDNREGIGTTVDHLASITTALNGPPGRRQASPNIAPTVFQNFMNILSAGPERGHRHPAPANFANTVEFVCSAIQAASRENYERSSKLCVQYLAPDRRAEPAVQLPAAGRQPVRGRSARPNELTYSEDRLRPDLPPPDESAAAAAVSTDPAAGLPGSMIPAGTSMKRVLAAILTLAALVALPGCQWRGPNPLALPGTQGNGPGSYNTISACSLRDVVAIQPNTRLRVGDVNVGNVTRVEVRDWHALVTMRINGDIQLPAKQREGRPDQAWGR